MESTMCRRYFDNSLIDCPECDMEPHLDISDPEAVVLGVVLHRKFGFKPRPLPRGGV